MDHKLIAMEGYKGNAVLWFHTKFIQMFDYVQHQEHLSFSRWKHIIKLFMKTWLWWKEKTYMEEVSEMCSIELYDKIIKAHSEVFECYM